MNRPAFNFINHILNNSVEPVDDDRTTLLHVCSQSGLVEECELLIVYGIGIDYTEEKFGWSPLMVACQHGQVEVVELLVKYGADPDLSDFYGNTPLTISIKNGNMELFNILLERSKPKFQTVLGEMTILAVACFFGQTEMAKIILEKYPDLIDTPVENSGMTPLMLASSAGNIETVKYLLNKGADKYVKNSNFETAAIFGADDDNELKTLFTPVTEKRRPVFLFADTPRCKRKIDMDSYPLTPNIVSRLNTEDEDHRIKKRSKSSERRPAPLKKKSSHLEIVLDILTRNGLSDYVTIFKEQKVGLNTFLNLDEDDLISLHVLDKSHRDKIIQAAKYFDRVLII